MYTIDLYLNQIYWNLLKRKELSIHSPEFPFSNNHDIEEIAIILIHCNDIAYNKKTSSIENYFLRSPITKRQNKAKLINPISISAE